MNRQEITITRSAAVCVIVEITLNQQRSTALKALLKDSCMRASPELDVPLLIAIGTMICSMRADLKTPPMMRPSLRLCSEKNGLRD